MNIAIFSPSQNPYSETFIQAHKNNLKGNIYYYYGIGSNITLENHPKLGSLFRRVQLKIVRKLLKKPIHKEWAPIVSDSLRMHNIHAVLVEYGTHATRMLPVLRAAKLPLIVHFHGYDASVHKTVASNNNYKDVFDYASYVVVVSKKMRAMILALGCPEEKLILNTYGPQKAFETLKPRYTKKQFIGIGRFTDKKAPYYTILAFSEVVKTHQDARLLLAGNGYLLNACKNLVNYLKIEEHVNFLGVVKPEEYQQICEESLAFVQHSITADNGDMEGTPLAVLEASVAGLPVISTFHAGIPDVIIHGKTGLLCKEHEVHTMAKNMRLLLNDKNRAMQMGAAGKANILENFTLKRYIDTLDDLLVEAINITMNIT